MYYNNYTTTFNTIKDLQGISGVFLISEQYSLIQLKIKNNIFSQKNLIIQKLRPN